MVCAINHDTLMYFKMIYVTCRYQQMLHRNLMYLAGLVDPNLQNMLPVRNID